MSHSSLSEQSLPGVSDRWDQLLAGLNVVELADRFLAEVRHLDDYKNPPVPLSQIRQDAIESFDGLVTTLGSVRDADTTAIANRVGVTRARAGIPLTSLMSAIRLDFTVLWTALLEVGGGADTDLLLSHAMTVWDIVEKYVQQTQHAYILEERRMADEIASVERGLVTELLADTAPSESRIDQLADSLGVGSDWTYSVFVGFDDAVAALRVAHADLQRRGQRSLATYRGGALAVIVAHNPNLAPVDLTSFNKLTVGRADCEHGLAGVATAVHVAEELASVFAPGETGAMTPARGWSRLVRRRLASMPIITEIDVERRLAECSANERDAILIAVRCYLANGSISESAAKLHCHRNTVTNRLRRFEELTGIDVTIPKEAARAVIALS